MALDYTAIVDGRLSRADAVARIYPDSADRPRFDTSRKVWVADDRQRHGFTVYVSSGTQGLFGGTLGDDGPWVDVEPGEYLDVELVLDKQAPPLAVKRAALELFGRLLATGDEDVSIIQNGAVLVAERRGGELRRYRAGFWDVLPAEQTPAIFQLPAAETRD